MSVSNKAQELLKVRVDACHPGVREDTEASRTSIEATDVKQIRVACKSTLHLSATVLLDFELQCTMVWLVLFLSPLRGWHSEQNKTTRSAQEVCQWYSSEACGKGMASLQGLVSAFRASGTISEVGLWSGGPLPPSGSSKLDEGHPIVVDQNIVASQLGELTIALLGQRLTSMSWSQYGYPGKLAGLLDATADPSILAVLRGDWGNSQLLTQYDRHPFLKKVYARPPFHLTFMTKACLACDPRQLLPLPCCVSCVMFQPFLPAPGPKPRHSRQGRLLAPSLAAEYTPTVQEPFM